MLESSGVSLARVQGTLLQRQDPGLRQGPAGARTEAPPAAGVSQSATPPADNLLTRQAQDPLDTRAIAGSADDLKRADARSADIGAPSATLARSQEQAERLQERSQIQELAKIDREVRAHEAAHAAAGGGHAGAPSFTYTRGPDGRLYATAGEVGIDTSRVANDPAATIEKARTVIAAALAPANPSPQDLRVAAQAQALLVEAQAELSRLDAQARAEEQSGAEATRLGDTEAAQSEESGESERTREAIEERLARSREQQEEFARQLQELNARLNDVQQQLIETGAIEGLNPEGTFLDLLV